VSVAGSSVEGRSGFFRRHAVKLVLSLLLGGGLAWMLASGQLPLFPPAAVWAAVRWWAVGAYLVSLVAVHWLRAARWRFLLRPLGEVSLRSVVLVSWIGFGAILLWPLRSGELVRPFLVTKRSSVRLWEATGSVAAERFVDALVLALVLFAGLRLSTTLDPLPDHVGSLPVPAAAVPRIAYLAVAGSTAVVLAMVAFYVGRARARALVVAVVGVVSKPLAERLASAVERLASGFGFLPSLRLLVPFLGETAAYWAVNALGVWLLLWAAGLPDPTLAEACAVVGCLGFGILLPAGPAYVGVFQLSAYMALALYFPGNQLISAGAAFVLLLWSCQVAIHVLATIVALAIDRDAAEKLALLPQKA
jgi:hypothetical protein